MLIGKVPVHICLLHKKAKEFQNKFIANKQKIKLRFQLIICPAATLSHHMSYPTLDLP